LLEDAAERLAPRRRNSGRCDFAADFEELEAAHRTISSFEMARNLTWEIQNHWNEISEDLPRRTVARRPCVHVRGIRRMRNVMHHCRKLLLHVFEQHDSRAHTGAAAGEATRGFRPGRRHPWVYMIWTTLHVPSISVPLFKGPNGLPIGAQLDCQAP
jgi:amidase